jgi:hypothetical protein
VLRLTDAEFYALTPRQYDALCRRQWEQIEHTELLVGIVASTVANFSLGAPKGGTKPADFMPSQFGKARPQTPKKERMSPKKRELIARNTRAMLMGVVEAQKQAGIKY